jgi:nicotinamidase-related amidase
MPDSKFSNGVLPEFLSNHAYIASSGREFALSAETTVEYLRWARQNGVQVVGFEVWRPTDPGPPPLPGLGCDGGAETCMAAVPRIVAAYGPDIVFNIWSGAGPFAE